MIILGSYHYILRTNIVAINYSNDLKCVAKLYHINKDLRPIRSLVKNSYDFSSYYTQYPDILTKPENYYPYLPICLMFDFHDALEAAQGKVQTTLNMILIVKII